MLCRLQIDTLRNIGRALMLTIPGHCFRLTVILHLSRSCTTGTKPASTKQKSVMMTMFMLKGHSCPGSHVLSFRYHFYDFYDTGAKSELNAACSVLDELTKDVCLLCSSDRWTHHRHLQAQAVSFPLGSFWWQGLWTHSGWGHVSCWGKP